MIKSLAGETDTTARNTCGENLERAVPGPEGGESARDASVAAIGPTGSGPFPDPVLPPREPLRAVSVRRRPVRQDVCPRFVWYIVILHIPIYGSRVYNRRLPNVTKIILVRYTVLG